MTIFGPKFQVDSLTSGFRRPVPHRLDYAPNIRKVVASAVKLTDVEMVPEQLLYYFEPQLIRAMAHHLPQMDSVVFRWPA